MRNSVKIDYYSKYLKYKNKYYNLINKHKKLKGGSASEIVMGLSGILLILGIIILFITRKDKELIPKDNNGNKLTFQNLEPHMMSEKINDFSYNYGLSMWLNIHNHRKS